VEKLEGFVDSSFHQLWHRGKRWRFGVYDTRPFIRPDQQKLTMQRLWLSENTGL